MNHFYQKIQGSFAYEFLYSHILNSCEIGKEYIFVEVGSWKGRSTSYMGVEIVNSNKKIKFYAVDTWDGSEEHMDVNNPSYEPLLQTKDGLYMHFLQNIESLKDIITPIRKTSVEASKMFKDGSVDYIMIDAAHDYENVLLDIQHWYPKLSEGGIISGDDLDWPGVNQAVNQYFGNDFINYSNKIWIKQK